MNIKEYLKDNFIYLDGGMGTLLQKEGLLPGELPERWNISHPDIITKIHRSYYDAGSNVVNTNTFGANLLKFSPEELDEIVKAAVANAKRAREESVSNSEKWIALDIGPSGRMLAPYGDFDFEDAVSLFAQTVKLGVKYGVDLIFIETMNDSYETKAALLAAKENCDLPVFVSNAYGEDGKLMTGASPSAMVAMLEGMRADAIGINCSLGPKALIKVAEEYLEKSSLPVILKPNAGLPKVSGGETVYDVLPDEFSEDVASLMKKGIHIAGGCCGTTPEYISSLVKKASKLSPMEITPKNITCVSSYTHCVEFKDSPILIGERINPTGKKRFKEALKNGDMDYILNEGISQQEKGVHIIDVNVGLPEIDEAKMLTDAVSALQAVVNLPLQIDTASPSAMEKALRRYNGKAMINSVNGKKESMEAVFPLAAKYGGLIVALTLDENGIPKSAEDRYAVAEKILAEAQKYGIDKKDIIFDPLTLTVSAEPDAAKETLCAVNMIKHKMGVHTSLGVSNVSFGLPHRDAVNSTFFANAMASGLSAAIMNPYSLEMMKAYYAFCALNSFDENFSQYLGFCETLTETITVTEVKKESVSPYEQGSSLQKAVIKGLCEQAAATTREMLESVNPLEIVQKEIIPALNIVGIGYEKQQYFLPQLLMSAEAAKEAFSVIKSTVKQSETKKDGAIILATVEGDIHDIGKNIVKLLLENYGFTVYDLGKDVKPEVILENAIKYDAKIVGLSALMTTTVPNMEKTIKLLKQKAPHIKTIVGGAVLTSEYANKIGADAYALDAMATVRLAQEML